MKRFLAAFAIALGLTSVAHATLMYTAPFNSVLDNQGRIIVCSAVNVSGQVGPITMMIVAPNGTAIGEGTHSCQTSSNSRVCEYTHFMTTNDPAGPFYCQVDTNNIARANVRAVVRVYNELTNEVLDTREAN